MSLTFIASSEIFIPKGSFVEGDSRGNEATNVLGGVKSKAEEKFLKTI